MDHEWRIFREMVANTMILIMGALGLLLVQVTMPKNTIGNNVNMVNMIDAESNLWAHYVAWLRGGVIRSGGPPLNLESRNSETIPFDVEAAANPNPIPHPCLGYRPTTHANYM